MSQEPGRDQIRLTRWLLAASAVVVTVSLAAQLGVLVWSGAAHRESRLFGDEVEYWRLSEGQLHSQFRPPGYPLIVHLMREVADSTVPIFLLQSVVAASTPIVVLLFAGRSPSSSRWPFLLGALFCGVSINALMLTKRVLADSLFGAVASLALAVVLLNRRRRPSFDLLAGGIAAVALAIKPVFVVWFPLVAIYVALSRPMTGWGFSAVARLTLLPAAIWLVGALAVKNHCGVASYSLSGDVTMQRYWLQATLCIAETGKWDEECIRRRRAEYDAGIFFQCPISPAELRASNAESRRLLFTHPMAAGRAYFTAMWRNLPRPFHAHELNAITARPIPPWLSYIKPLTFVAWFLAMLGLLSLARRDPKLAIGMLLAMAAFAFATAICFWEGNRLLYPAEPILLALASFGVCALSGGSEASLAAPKV